MSAAPVLRALPRPLAGALAAVPAVDLASVLEAAALQRRVDRKYLVPVADVAAVVTELGGPGHRVLEIDGRRSTSYRSTYLDTPELALCRAHLQGRRLRWKARSRLYVEDGLCRFEVKQRGRREETVKHALDREAGAYGHFTEEEAAFLRDLLSEAPGEASGIAIADDLHPVLEVTYTRATLVDLEGGARLTLDHGVTGRRLDGTRAPLRAGTVTIDADRVIVETKGGARPGAADRLLLAAGHRPLSLSKYATSAALLSADLADNRVRPLLGRGLTLRLEAGDAAGDLEAAS